MSIWENCDAVEQHPDRVSEEWVFRGTRVPIAALFEKLRDRATIDEFLACFPGVERSQVEAVLATEEAEFERHWAAMPEGKLELIDGKLIISTLAGSRWIMREILRDYGPDLILPMAPAELCWSALQQAFTPHPLPATVDEWREWADRFHYEIDVAPAGPRGTDRHWQLRDLLRWAFYYLGEGTGVGLALGPDSVIRLGEDGPTPDLIFIDRPGLARLRGRYLDGPPAVAVEIVTPGSEDQDRVLKRRLYEQGGVPEYWLIDPELPRLTFHRLRLDGHYEERVFDAQELARITEAEEDTLYHSTAVPGLSLSLRRLWTMKAHDLEVPLQPLHLDEAYRAATKRPPHGRGGIRWDEIPFAPRVELDPVPIRFEEYLSWCGRAKFEGYGGGIKIDGSEGTRRVGGMLLMTLGLAEVVRLAHPREWITFLDREPFLPGVREEAERFMGDAKYERHAHRPDEVYYSGKIAALPDLWAYGESEEGCARDLRRLVEGWILLRIARREPLPQIAAG